MWLKLEEKIKERNRGWLKKNDWTKEGIEDNSNGMFGRGICEGFGGPSLYFNIYLKFLKNKRIIW